MLHPMMRLARKYTQYFPRKYSRFLFNGRSYPYFCRAYNQTWMNERCVEVPLAMEYVRPGLRILEVGRVLDHYYSFPHDCVDKFEKGALNVDVVDFKTDVRYDVIISISTLEHVGWDEDRNPEKIFTAIEVLKRHLKPGGKLVVTLPWGYNANLDAELIKGRRLFDEQFYFKMIPFGRWVQTPDLERIDYLFRDGIGRSMMLGVTTGT